MSIANTHNEFPQAPFERIEKDVSRVKRRSAHPCQLAAQGQAARSQHVAPAELETMATCERARDIPPRWGFADPKLLHSKPSCEATGWLDRVPRTGGWPCRLSGSAGITLSGMEVVNDQGRNRRAGWRTAPQLRPEAWRVHDGVERPSAQHQRRPPVGEARRWTSARWRG